MPPSERARPHWLRRVLNIAVMGFAGWAVLTAVRYPSGWTAAVAVVCAFSLGVWLTSWHFNEKFAMLLRGFNDLSAKGEHDGSYRLVGGPLDGRTCPRPNPHVLNAMSDAVANVLQPIVGEIPAFPLFVMVVDDHPEGRYVAHDAGDDRLMWEQYE